MHSVSSPPTTCRYCKHYEFEGHRGGNCQQLGVAVQGNWMACRLMIPCTEGVTPEIVTARSAWEACPLG